MKEFIRKQKIEGNILGGVLGDALGTPVEFCKSYIVKDLTSVKFSDDSQLMHGVAEALLKTPPHKYGEESFMNELSKNFMNWQSNPFGGGHRSPGGACMSGANNLKTKHWTKSGGTSSKGNGSVMRSSIVACFYHTNPAYAFRIGCLTSVPTHNNLEPILCSGLIAYLVAESINGTDFATSIARGLKLCGDYENTVPSYPKNVRIGNGWSEQNPAYTIAHIASAYAHAKNTSVHDFTKLNGDTFNATPALAAAVYYSAKYSNYTKSVLDAVNNTGDSDTTACMTGNLSGARWGSGMIYRKWRDSVEQSAYWHDLANRIYLASNEVVIPTSNALFHDSFQK